ncbi:TIGR00269 family protein [Candidatus Woesearchaeota archaeon]|nr:TIGR00269 family protein [Candidatus Woesearchaeota archaeon]
MKPVHTLEGGEKLTKKGFLKYFEKKVRKTIRVNKLVGKRERILVACSGGKDSTAALYLMNKIVANRNIKVEAMHVDQSIGEYSKVNRRNIEKFCSEQGIKLHVTSFREFFGMAQCYIKDALRDKGINWKSCAICGVLRRYIINKFTRDLKATRIVTGHNLDDEAQTTLMNLFNNRIDLLARQGPKSGPMKHRHFVPRIKPLYMCKEEEVLLYSKLMKFPVQYEPCPCRTDSYRLSVLKLLDEFEKSNKGTKSGIVNSYLELMPLLKKNFKKGKINSCDKCGEPTSGEVCNSCKILGKIWK